MKSDLIETSGLRLTSADLKHRFFKIPMHGYPIIAYQCKMSAFSNVAYGYGDGFNPKLAQAKAFNEAFERLIFFMNSRALAEKNGLRVISSNGLAAAKSRELAIKLASNELIERHMLLSAWCSMQGWHKHEPKSVVARLLKSFYARKGWSILFYTIKSRCLKEVLCVVLKHSDHGVIFDSDYIDGNEVRKSENKLILSATRMIVSFLENKKMNQFSRLNINCLNEEAKPFDHFAFYSNPKNADALNFLETSVNNSQIEILEIDKITTKLLFKSDDLPHVAMAENPAWPKISWGRQSISGINPWPHPLA